MVTHNGVEALDWADRILLMEKGKITRDDLPEVFYNTPRSLKEARFFGEVNKIAFEEEQVYFRPSFFALHQDAVHTLRIEVEFYTKSMLGWYSVFYFKCGNALVQLYSVDDISHVDHVYIRKITLND